MAGFLWSYWFSLLRNTPIAERRSIRPSVRTGGRVLSEDISVPRRPDYTILDREWPAASSICFLLPDEQWLCFVSTQWAKFNCLSGSGRFCFVRYRVAIIEAVVWTGCQKLTLACYKQDCIHTYCFKKIRSKISLNYPFYRPKFIYVVFNTHKVDGSICIR